MSDDTIAGVVITAGALLVVGTIGLYWRQRLRFTGRVDPAVTGSIRWWKGPLGLGWRQALLRLGVDGLAFRRRISFRSGATLELARIELKVVERAAPRWADWLWVGPSEVITLQTSNRRLELAMLPADAELFVDWLGSDASPAAPRRNRSGLVLFLAWIAITVVFFVQLNPKPWLLLALPLGVLVVSFGWGLVGRRIAASDAARDELVIDAGEVFSFLRDFGFFITYAQHLPWRAALVFDDDGARLVIVSIDRRREVLDVELIDEEPDPPVHRRLRDLLAEAGHPDPDRVTRYTGADGPLRAALEANAHALRLWGRSFLVDSETAKA